MTDKRVNRKTVNHIAKQTAPTEENNKHDNLKVFLKVSLIYETKFKYKLKYYLENKAKHYSSTE